MALLATAEAHQILGPSRGNLAITTIMGDLRVFGPALLLGHFGLGRSLVLLETSAPRTVLILFAIAIAASWRNGGPLGSTHAGGCSLFCNSRIESDDWRLAVLRLPSRVSRVSRYNSGVTAYRDERAHNPFPAQENSPYRGQICIRLSSISR